MIRCSYCPVSPGKQCHGETGALPHLCEWAASGDPLKINSVIGRAEFPPPGHLYLTPKCVGASVVIRSYLSSYTGYGNIAEWLGRLLESRGHVVRYLSIHTDESFRPLGEFVASRILAAPCPGAPVLQLATPDTLPLPGVTTLAFTMWESSGLAASAVEALNQSQGVIVPCLWNRDNFRAAGVLKPIDLVPLGYDPGEGYTPQPWDDARPITFGMAARMAHGGIRKGLHEGLAAFRDAFPDRDDVRLKLKVFEDCLPRLRLPDDQRVTVQTEGYSPAQMAAWYGSIDVLFVPSKGEGWGLHTLQAMACGRPVVAAHYGGTAAFWEPALGWPLDFDEAPAGEFYTGQGNWCVPRHQSMVAALRLASADRLAIRSKGAASAARARAFQWEATGDALLRVLSPFLPARPTPQLPGLLTRAANLASALGTHIKAGLPVLAEADYQKRLAICKTCDQFLPGGQCASCGCNLRIKARWSEQSCPLGKWPVDLERDREDQREE